MGRKAIVFISFNQKVFYMKQLSPPAFLLNKLSVLIRLPESQPQIKYLLTPIRTHFQREDMNYGINGNLISGRKVKPFCSTRSIIF